MRFELLQKVMVTPSGDKEMGEESWYGLPAGQPVEALLWARNPKTPGLVIVRTRHPHFGYVGGDYVEVPCDRVMTLEEYDAEQEWDETSRILDKRYPLLTEKEKS